MKQIRNEALRGVVAVLALVQLALGMWLLSWAWEERSEPLPIAAGLVVALGALSTATGIAAARHNQRLAAALVLAGGVMGLPLIATLIYAPLPILQLIFARYVVEHVQISDDLPDRETYGHSSVGRIVIVMACLQITLGSLSIWNGLRDDPAPLTVFDYVRSDEADPKPSWPAVPIGLAIAAGGVLIIRGLHIAGHQPHAGASLIALGATLGLGLTFFLAIVPLFLAAFGLSATRAIGARPPVSKTSGLLKSR